MPTRAPTDRRRRAAPLAAGVAAALLAGSSLQAQRAPAAAPTPAAAEAALARRDLDGAVRLASSYTHRHPDDPRGWLVLGKARLARSSGSAEHRLQAIWAFRRVVALRPADLEAWDLMGRAALLLGGADGEHIAAEAFEHLLALVPTDREAWRDFLLLYRGRGERARMRRILAPHDSLPEVRLRIARLLIEDEAYDSADAVLDRLLRDDPLDPGVLASRAQSAFEAGDDSTGARTYARALRYADQDDRGVLWSQVTGIATPAEVRLWQGGVPPAMREGFLRSFWARRNPDLFAGANRRIAEHFRRLREARKRYPLLHPLNAYNRNDTTRAPELRPSEAENAFYLMCEAQEFPGAPMRAEDRRRMPFPASGFWAYPDRGSHGPSPAPSTGGDLGSWQAPSEPGDIGSGGLSLLFGPYLKNVADVDTTASHAGYNLRTGLDDRGVMYLRFGPPAHTVVGANNVETNFCRIAGLERWDYPGIGQVRFFRPNAVSVNGVSQRTTGDMTFRPQNAEQFGATEAGLTRDVTSVPATLSFALWLAEFAHPGDRRRTDLVVFATRSRVAAQMVSAVSGPAATGEDSVALVVLSAAPGRYALEVHARSGDSLGRLQRTVSLSDFAEGRHVSSLVLATAWPDTAVDRRTILARAERDLVFPADSAVRAYAEVYGLPPTVSGTARYHASYELYPTGDPARDVQRDSLPGGTVFGFDRERRETDGRVVEWLDLTPELLPPGRYLLRLTVREARAGPVVGRGQIGFEIAAR
jgi:tetratricopeptide (TPR) repeat protein